VNARVIEMKIGARGAAFVVSLLPIVGSQRQGEEVMQVLAILVIGNRISA
jgi:Cu/Ag efflux pump CusA